MKILYHHRTQGGDAQGIHICEMVKAFRGLGHEVEVIGLVPLDPTEESRKGRRIWDWIVASIPRWVYEVMSVAYNVYGYWCLCSAITSKRPDLIYERYALNTFCGIWAGRRFGIPVILEVNAPLYHEEGELGRLIFKRFARFSERWICANSTWTIIVSHSMKRLLQGGGSIPNTIVMPNGIDARRFHRKISEAEIRKQYELQGKLVIGFVGWFRKWHGLEMLLKVMNDLHLGERGVRLLLVGDGPAYPELYRYAREHRMVDFVHFTGPVHQNRIPEYIASMDIAVQPSVTEYACPMKIIEYMAMAKCILAPDQPNIREILRHEINSLLFEPGNEAAFKSGLMKVLENPAMRERLGRAAWATIHRQRLFWSENAKKTIALVGLRRSSPGEAGFSPEEYRKEFAQ